MIKVDAVKCLGCLSCSTVCPSQNIVRTETEKTRSIHWKRCKEECDLCVEFCPGKALTLVPFDEASAEPDISFDLVACKICGSRYATEPMLKRIEATLPEKCRRMTQALPGSGSVRSAGEMLRQRGLPSQWCWAGAERVREISAKSKSKKSHMSV